MILLELFRSRRANRRGWSRAFLLVAEGEQLRRQLGAALASSGDQPAAWQDQEALAPIARLGQQYLAQHGLRYADGAVTAVAVSR